MKKFLAVIIALLIICYPFIVYFGLNYFSIRYVALGIAFIFLLRLILVRSSLSVFSKRFLISVALVGIGVSLIGVISNKELIIKLYPFVMNFFIFCLFSYSLFCPPTIIERLARLTYQDLPKSAIKYTQKVTIVWCIFFTINGAIALWTALFASMKVWTFYNGFVSYILIGVLFVTEFFVRQIVKRRINVENQNA